MQKYFSLLLLACFTTLIANAQTREIKGTVLDAGNRATLPGVIVLVKGGAQATRTGHQGDFRLTIPAGPVVLQLRHSRYHTQEVLVKAATRNIVILLQPAQLTLNDATAPVKKEAEKVMQRSYGFVAAAEAAPVMMYAPPSPGAYGDYNTEDYSPINENDFHAVTNQPLSTFSIDVDRAAYSNIRRFLNNGALPPADAVRVEEMINYFDYQYKAPTGTDPVAIYTDMALCPWNTRHQLVRIGLKGSTVAADKIPPSNLVFLVDVSGSMNEPNKLPLVKQALKTLVRQLRPADKVAIAVYAGAAGLVLPATPGNEKTRILDALDQLQAGGSTAGGEGILLAYKTAAENFMKAGNNRVIIATDGDFNVGPSSDGALQRIIEKERDKGISLSVLGFGMGNYKDNKLELLADKGNGNYAYIDNFEEARRTFVTEFGGTLFTIAKDVKLQVEFNPRYVQSYRLVGYENRLLQNEDFNNDKKDAGDMGAGHTVTALYEIVPAGSKATAANRVDPLKYQQRTVVSSPANEVLTVKLRYKRPADSQSRLMTRVLPYQLQDITTAPVDFRMCAAVAEFGQLLRNSAHKGQASYSQVLALAKDAKGDDPEGYRAEFVQLVKKAALLQPGSQVARE
ncbi:MAG TPA: von Willebrand factor type A domain-containing protein [Chitinophaga sp.]|uniref:YfbK domain-containing protein n=1 Tax=Chitinophaga sp. TaxID=1869181 RepID=UPI002DBD2882|nr:von Willebrand factor type A domain-containing protein [Chitinophaga sp.]HEU4552600.1 von Willebrand factor type A domain-containing protein [Chitinophaga sp.]